MPVTLAALLRQPALGLTMLAGTEDVQREISWVHASELADPTPYLDGGELLLSVGMWLDPTHPAAELAEQAAAYVQRLVDVGVVGLGFGVGVQHNEVPPELVAAAGSAGLPMLEVPEQTAFVAVGRSVWEALSAEQHAEVTRTSSAQQDLTRAAVSSGAAGLLRRLAERLDGWALMLDAAGTVQHAAPAGAERRAAWLATELERFRDLSTPVSATLSVENDQIAVQSLRLGRRTAGFLAVGSPVRLNREQRTVLNTAASLLTLILAQTSALRAAESQLRTAVFELLLEGDVNRAARLVGGLGGGMPADPVRLLLATGSSRSRDDLAELLDLTIGPRGRNPAAAGERVLHAAVGDRLAVLYPAAGRLRSRVLAAAAGVPGVTAASRPRSAAPSWPGRSGRPSRPWAPLCAPTGGSSRSPISARPACSACWPGRPPRRWPSRCCGRWSNTTSSAAGTWCVRWPVGWSTTAVGRGRGGTRSAPAHVAQPHPPGRHAARPGPGLGGCACRAVGRAAAAGHPGSGRVGAGDAPERATGPPERAPPGALTRPRPPGPADPRRLRVGGPGSSSSNPGFSAANGDDHRQRPRLVAPDLDQLLVDQVDHLVGRLHLGDQERLRAPAQRELAAHGLDRVNPSSGSRGCSRPSDAPCPRTG